MIDTCRCPTTDAYREADRLARRRRHRRTMKHEAQTLWAL
jgi:hypothetical protein